MSDIDEPLAESAVLALSIAGSHCRKDPVSGENCAWYHGLWQELRLMDLAASPRHHATFFLQALEMLYHGRDSLRILISGAADYSILAHVLHACQKSGVTASITVTDICDTPLKLNDWYASRADIKIRTLRADILDYRPETPFDIICSHSFLGQFDAARRARIVSHWQHLLAQGGALLTTNRIRPETLHDPVKFSKPQIRDFLKTVAARANCTGPELDRLLERAQLYARHIHAYAISEPDLISLFTDQGYRIADLSVVNSAGSATNQFHGLAIPAEARHACIIATRNS